jgi:hypothetical protein
MFLDEKHYEQDVYDEKGRLESPGAQAPSPPEAASSPTRSFNRGLIGTAIAVVTLLLAWAIPPVRLLMILVGVVVLAACFISWSQSGPRRKADGTYTTAYEQQYEAKTNTVVTLLGWLVSAVVGIFSLGSKSDDR